MSQLSDLAQTDRNPIQESQYQDLLKQNNIPFTVENGKANVTGFGIGGNGTGDAANAFFNQGGAQAQQDQTNYNNLVASNTKSVNDFLTKYQGDVTSAQDTANTKFNIPTLENLVTNLGSRITDLEYNADNSGGGSVGNTGAGGFSNAGQVDAALSSKYLPSYNTAVGNLNTGEGLAQTYIQNALAPDQAYGTLLANNIDAAMQGLTATQQTEMQQIITKLQTNTALTTAEIAAGEQYAQAILPYAYAKTMAQINAQYNGIPSNNIVYNPSSGQFVNPAVLAAAGA